MQVGDILNQRFKLDRYIGRGSRGECWQVLDTNTQKKCLAKLYHINQGNWNRYDLLEREATLLGQLDHPMIPKFHALFVTEQNDALCLVREWIPGTNLEQYIEEKRLSEVDVRLIARKLLKVLHYIHGLSPAVLHRDIKPSNIILTPDDSISLLDFGSVRDSINAEEGLSVMGTYGYTPPEQFLGRPVKASDLYALGATLVFLLSRHHPVHLPFERNRIQFESYINVQPRFLRILQKLLAPNVEDRFHDAGQVLQALKRCEPTDHLPATSTITPKASPSKTSVEASLSEPKRPWQRNRELPQPWSWERAEEETRPIAYQPDLQAVIQTLEERYALEGLDDTMEALDLINAIDVHFGFHDETGRQWLLRLLHPYDAADILFGYYTTDFILSRYGTLFMERFALLHTHDDDNAINQWILLYFLHKHGWQPQDLWYENEQLPFRYSFHRLFGTLQKTRRFVDQFQAASIGAQAKQFEKLEQHSEEIARLYHLCVSLRPAHLDIIVEKGLTMFEESALSTYSSTLQHDWRQITSLRWAVRRLLLWPPRWLPFRHWLGKDSTYYHKLGAYISGIYFLYHDLDLLRIRLQQEYHWLLPKQTQHKALPTFTTHTSPSKEDT
tara:strand:+ start:2368 stop:4209 length:1842 start_codon:yes stop_codon:yes gene_type:complete